MASGDRAILFPLRVTGTEEAAQAFKKVGAAATGAIGDVAKAAAAQQAYEASVVRAQTASAALGSAQAKANADLAAARGALKSGAVSAEEYATATLDIKNSLALVRAEQGLAVNGLKATSVALAEARARADGLDPALVRVSKGSGQMRMGFQQLSFQINDVATQFASGTPAMQIFAQQSGQVFQSVQLMSGGASKFAQFMGGPWGAALTAALTVLVSLIAQSDLFRDKVGEATDKLREQGKEADIARQAQEAYGHTLDGLIDKEAKLTEELKKQLKSQREVNAERLTQAQDRADKAQNGDPNGKSENDRKGVNQLKTERDKLQSDIKQLSSATLIDEGTANYIARLEGRLADVVKLLATKQGEVTEATANYRRLQAIELQRQAQIDSEPNGAKIEALEVKRDNLTADFVANRIEAKAYRTELAALDKQIRELQKTSSSGADADSRSKQQVWNEFHDALARHGVVQAAGATGFRTAEQQNAQFKAGLSPLDGYKKISRHQTWEAFDPTRGSFNEEAARAAANEVGLKGFEVVTESGGRKHFEWKGHQRGPDVAGSEKAQREAEAAARKAEQLREQAIRREQQFQDAIAGADRSLLDAKRANVHDAAQIAALDRQDVEAAKVKTLADIDAKEKLGDYTKAQAELLREKAEQTAAERLITINTREAQRIADEKLQLSENDLSIQREMLDGQLALAKTADERRSIQLRQLELDKQAEKLQLEAIVADQTATAAAKASAAARLRSLDSIYGDRRQATLQQTAGPGESYLRDLSRTPDQMNEALQQVKVDGLKALNDGLVDAIVNFHSLGDVAQNVLRTVLHDLVELSVEKYITNPLAKKLFPEQAANLANDNATQLAQSAGEMIAAGASLTSAAVLWSATAAQIGAAAAALAASGGGGRLGGLSAGDPLASLFDSVLGGGGGSSSAGIASGISAGIAGLGFASGTDMVPVGKPFFVGENGMETMINRGGGRLQVINGPRTHRAAQASSGGVVINQIVNVPERVDPRRTAVGIARSTQGAIGRAHRKGLAMTGGRS